MTCKEPPQAKERPPAVRHQRPVPQASTPLVDETAPESPKPRVTASAALRLATEAAWALATLAKDHSVNQITIAEEDGIPSLLELVRDSRSSSHESATKAIWHLGQMVENQSAIPRAGGIAPLVELLSHGNAITQQYTAAALESLAKDHLENQIALAKAGAIAPLVELLGSESKDTQEHAVGALLYLAAHDEQSRNAVVRQLVDVLDVRNAAAQLKSAEALAVLAARSSENRKAITAANAVEPLVRLLGDGRRVRSDTPQERAAAVLSDLARLSENKVAIVKAGAAPPLVMMLSSESAKAATQAAGALGHLAAVSENKSAIASAGGIKPLVELLSSGTAEAQRFATGALWHLAAVGDNKIIMVAAGAIPPLVTLLGSDVAEACEYAAAVLSMLARSQGGNKRAIVQAGGIAPLVELLADQSVMTQRHAACALWGLSEGKEGVYDKQIVEKGAVRPLIQMLMLNHPETRGFAAACLLCLCQDEAAREAILTGGGAELWVSLAASRNVWLKTQAIEMLRLLEIPYTEPTLTVSPRPLGSPGRGGANGQPGGGPLASPSRSAFLASAFPLVATKTLPIREESSIDPDKVNERVGELNKGDTCHVLERKEVVTGTFRALVALDSSKDPAGWVTAGKEGADFLVSESTYNQIMLGNTPNHVKMKFHFFSFQLPMNVLTAHQQIEPNWNIPQREFFCD